MSIQKNLRAYIALFIVCILWGTSYFAIRIGVKTFPPYLFSAMRQLIAGTTLLAGLALTGNLKLTRNNIWHQSIAGVLILAFGNGVIGWCERYISSGLAALVLSLTPLFIVVINYLLGYDNRKPHMLLISGMILGLLGTVLIFGDNLRDIANPGFFKGLLLAFAACLAIAFGAVYAKRNVADNKNIMQNAALQLFLAGVALLIASALTDDYSEIRSINLPSVWALTYLIVFGSIVAYTCFVYALKHLPIGVVSIYAFINPFVAVLLGCLFLNESFTIVTLLALLAVSFSVYLINKGYSKMAKI